MFHNKEGVTRKLGLALLSVVVFALTTEVTLAAAFRALGVRGMNLLWATELVGSASFAYWYWAGKVFLQEPSKIQRWTHETIRQTDELFRYYFHSHIANTLVLGLVFLIGVCPILWIGAVVFCEEEKSKVGIGVLFTANIVKIAGSVLLLFQGR